MTEDSSKDSSEILKDLSKPMGAYGIKTAQGLSVWLDQWIVNGGDQRALEGLTMIINKDTTHMTMWVTKEVFTDER